MDRAAMLNGRSKSYSGENDHNFSLVTTYSHQYYDIKNIGRY